MACGAERSRDVQEEQCLEANRSSTNKERVYFPVAPSRPADQDQNQFQEEEEELVRAKHDYCKVETVSRVVDPVDTENLRK